MMDAPHLARLGEAMRQDTSGNELVAFVAGLHEKSYEVGAYELAAAAHGPAENSTCGPIPDHNTQHLQSPKRRPFMAPTRDFSPFRQVWVKGPEWRGQCWPGLAISAGRRGHLTHRLFRVR